MRTTTGAVLASVASARAAKALFGLLHALCGTMKPLHGLHMRNVGYCSHCVGSYSLNVDSTCAMWDVATSAWSIVASA